MKKIGFLFILFSLFSNSYSQGYRKIIDSSNKWNYLDQAFTTCCLGEARTYSLFLTNDTLISDTTYKKVMCRVIKYNGIDSIYAGALREDSIKQSVFIRIQDHKEKLLYSFDHTIGDTLSIDTANWKDTYTIRYIKSMDTYDFNGFQGKKIGICDTTFRTNAPHLSPSETLVDYWYEGIGSLKEPFDLSHIGGFGVDMKLLCFWNNNIQIYQDKDWTICEFAIFTGIEDEKSKINIEIFPNPATNEVKIETDLKIKMVTVIDINGNEVIKQKEKCINVSNLQSGIYFLKIQFSNNQFVTKKIIKNAL